MKFMTDRFGLYEKLFELGNGKQMPLVFAAHCGYWHAAMEDVPDEIRLWVAGILNELAASIVEMCDDE